MVLAPKATWCELQPVRRRRSAQQRARVLRSLVTVRVSQMNWCRFCVDINCATLAARAGSMLINYHAELCEAKGYPLHYVLRSFTWLAAATSPNRMWLATLIQPRAIANHGNIAAAIG